MSKRLILLAFILFQGLISYSQNEEEFQIKFSEALHLEEERFNQNAGLIWHELHEMHEL